MGLDLFIPFVLCSFEWTTFAMQPCAEFYIEKTSKQKATTLPSVCGKDFSVNKSCPSGERLVIAKDKDLDKIRRVVPASQLFIIDRTETEGQYDTKRYKKECRCIRFKDNKTSVYYRNCSSEFYSVCTNTFDTVTVLWWREFGKTTTDISLQTQVSTNQITTTSGVHFSFHTVFIQETTIMTDIPSTTGLIVGITIGLFILLVSILIVVLTLRRRCIFRKTSSDCKEEDRTVHERSHFISTQRFNSSCPRETQEDATTGEHIYHISSHRRHSLSQEENQHDYGVFARGEHEYGTSTHVRKVLDENTFGHAYQQVEIEIQRQRSTHSEASSNVKVNLPLLQGKQEGTGNGEHVYKILSPRCDPLPTQENQHEYDVFARGEHEYDTSSHVRKVQVGNTFGHAYQQVEIDMQRRHSTDPEAIHNETLVIQSDEHIYDISSHIKNV